MFIAVGLVPRIEEDVLLVSQNVHYRFTSPAGSVILRDSVCRRGFSSSPHDLK